MREQAEIFVANFYNISIEEARLHYEDEIIAAMSLISKNVI